MIARKKVKKKSGVEIISNRYARNNVKKNEINRARKSMVRKAVKKFLGLLEKDVSKDELKAAYIEVQKKLMSKKSTDVFGVKKCSRIFSRITKKAKL